MPGRVDWTFRTERIRGRLVESGDRALYHALYADPRVMADIGPTLSAEAIDALFDKVLAWNRGDPVRARYWRMSDAKDAPIGLYSLVISSESRDTADLGQMQLADRQGNGFGAEISLAMLDWVMEDRWGLGLSVATMHHSPDNWRVKRLGEMVCAERLDTEDGASEAWRLDRTQWLEIRERLRMIALERSGRRARRNE